MILLVDDKQENLFSLKTLLQLHKYEVDTASSGEEALIKILKTQYSLIILDVQMPEMDGFEVAETVSGYSKTKSIPIIFLSAVNTDKRFISKGYASGAVDYVTKPFDEDLLLLKVQTFCRLSEQTRELKLIQAALKEEIGVRKETENALHQLNIDLEQKVKDRTAELLKMNAALERSNIELQQYAFVASHDLQEPLRKITTYIKLIEEKFLPLVPEAGHFMKKIILSSERMRNMINDLLNYSKLSASPEFLLTDLNETLKNTLVDLEVTIQEKQARITSELLPQIQAIPGQIRQVFQHIISNALKFSKNDQTPVIRIRSENIAPPLHFANVDPSLKYVRIYFEDNGIGFNEAYGDKIFTLFQRLHSKDKFEGTGIGLAIVKKIIQKHNGYLTASSKEGTGTTFSFILPVTQPVTVETHPQG